MINLSLIQFFLFFLRREFYFAKPSQCLEYYSKGIFYAYASFLLGWVIARTAFKGNSPDVCLIWNGTKAFSRGVAHACKQKKIRVRFIELGNFTNKLFIDDDGTNKNSSLYKNISQLEKLHTDYDKAEDWLAKYIDAQRCISEPPQLKLEKTINITKFQKLSRKLKFFLYARKPQKYLFCDFSSPIYQQKTPTNYTFVPLQVSNDSQILLNSKINNLDLIKTLIARQKRDGGKFVIKFHPCDSEYSVSKILDLVSGNQNWLVNQGSTINLIEKASKVVCINSTVGLEAILLGKDVEFLGHTFFARMTKAMALAYVTEFLVDIDYFSNQDFNMSEFNKITGIAEV